MVRDPTRVTMSMTTSSTADLIITSANSSGFNVTSSGKHDPGISDHHLIYAVTDIHWQKRKPKTDITHKIENIEQLAFSEDLR